MNIVKLLTLLFLAYLLGSLATAVWVGKLFHKIDVREHGSCNAGATNVIRVLGWKTGIPVLLIDMAKGWLAASLPQILNLAEAGSAQLTNLQIAAGLLAVTGHIYPVFAGFRGGKGVATIFGAVLAIHPLLTLASFGFFVIILLITGYVSISSMSAGIAFPFLLFLLFDTPSVVFKAFAIFIAAALVVTHRKNIKRLIRGEESKFIKIGRKTKRKPADTLNRPAI